MLDTTFGSAPLHKMFGDGDIYQVRYNEERASRKPVRLGVIGAGGIALAKYLPAVIRLQTMWEPVELVAVARRDERAGKHIEEIYGCRWYADYAEMLEKESMDGVIVAGPDQVHAEHAIACLDKGLPVLVEKPITRSLVDSTKMCRLGHEKGIPIMTVANKRYSPPYRNAKRCVEEGPVDNPAMLAGKFNHGYNYVYLFETATIHLYDITRYFMGDVRAVHAMGVNKYSGNIQPYPVDNAVIALEFTSGSVGTLWTTNSAVSLKPWELVEVYGNKAWLSVDDQYQLNLYDSEEGPTKSWRPVIPHTMVSDLDLGGFLGLMDNFLQVIRGVEKPVVTGWDGHHAYEMNVASHLSIHRKETVQLPLDPASADEECREWIASSKAGGK